MIELTLDTSEFDLAMSELAALANEVDMTKFRDRLIGLLNSASEVIEILHQSSADFVLKPSDHLYGLLADMRTESLIADPIQPGEVDF